MNVQKYNDMVLDDKFTSVEKTIEKVETGISKLVSEQHLENKGLIEAVDVKITFTNGKIAQAMKDIEDLKGFRTGVQYAWTIFGLMVLPIMAYTVFKVWNTDSISEDQIRSTIQQSISQSFIHYNATHPAATTTK